MHESKIKIKMGPIEVEYEGSEGFLKEELLALMKSVSDLYQQSCKQYEDTEQRTPNEPGNASGDSLGSEIQMTTDTIASRLGCKTGADLIIAACARLILVSKKTSANRKEILSEMQTATGHYKKSFAANLSKSLSSLVRGKKISEIAKDSYALTDAEKTDLRAKLAEQK